MQIQLFKRELLEIPGVVSAANSSNLVGEYFGDQLYHPAEGTKEDTQIVWRMWTDPDYIETYGMEMIQGQYFSGKLNEDQRGIVLNEAAVKSFNLSDPVGKKLIDMDNNELTIIGVLKNFHFESLHQNIKPFAVHSFGEGGGGKYMSLRVTSENIRQTLSEIEKTWKKFAANQAFEYEFFDEYFGRVYLTEARTGRIFMVFSILAILIACLGLFGLTSFITQQRTKEIGIRKILGASVSGIVLLFLKNFTKWILVANLVAWPAAYYIMFRWLQSFAYRTDFGVEIFLLSAGMALGIALLTVGFQSVKAASANPVDSLRYE